MDRDRVAQNLAVVESHFHSEALNEVEVALETFTDDVVWEAPAPNGLNRSFSGKEATAKNYRELFASSFFSGSLPKIASSMTASSRSWWQRMDTGIFQSEARLKCGWFTFLRCETGKSHGRLSSTWDALRSLR
jgi:hypothetical protein